MANTRQYRRGLGHDRAVAILREHAGSQWDPAIVETVATVATDDAAGVFEKVGHTDGSSHVPACGCLDALPRSVQPLLV
jgi:response regulator RpfG family c-di-GMP phosphodiesterase